MSRYRTAFGAAAKMRAFGPILIELLNILTDLNSLFALSKSVVQWPKTCIFAAAPNAVRYLDIVFGISIVISVSKKNFKSKFLSQL